MLDKTQIANLRRLAKSSVNEDGEVRPFAEQLTDYAMGDLPSGEIFVVSNSISEFGLPINDDYPLVLSQKNAKKIELEHDINLKQLSKLPQWLKQHPLAMESFSIQNALLVFADARDVHGNEILVALHVEKTRGAHMHEIVVDEIASVYGKENLGYFLENTARAGQKIYVNEKTKSWLLLTGVPFPPLATSSVINEYTKERITTEEQFDAISKEPVKPTSKNKAETHHLEKNPKAANRASGLETIERIRRLTQEGSLPPRGAVGYSPRSRR